MSLFTFWLVLEKVQAEVEDRFTWDVRNYEFSNISPEQVYPHFKSDFVEGIGLANGEPLNPKYG